MLRNLGRDGPSVSAIGLGTMGMGAFLGPSDDNASFDTLTSAANRGMTFWDTADIYGHSEELIGTWFNKTGRRSEIFLATKFGNWDPTSTEQKPNSKPSYIATALQRSLARLQTDYIDLYYQHRVDPDVPIEVVLEALRPFLDNGTIKWIGLSEPNIDTLRRAKAVPDIRDKVVAAQMEFSPFELSIEKSGFVDAVNELGMAVVAYAPLAHGLATERFSSSTDFDSSDMRRYMPKFSSENFSKNLEVSKKLKAIADTYQVTLSQFLESAVFNV
ncbi:hypothetical protein H0H92_001314 [Tricholoma furcatifolium]|nr:hypothetical protein H0H92_001314 [Tricholoma furcatifolium]